MKSSSRELALAAVAAWAMAGSALRVLAEWNKRYSAKSEPKK